MVRHALLLSVFICAVQSYPQDIASGTVSGFVYDAESGEALIGANVFLRDTHLGAATNTGGFYSLPKIPRGSYVLVCQFIGYETYTRSVEVKAETDLKITIYLRATTIELRAVQVVADCLRVSERLYNKPISKINLRPRQLERVPQVVETDLLRTLQAMPGILPISDYSSELYVRGGTPDQNLYLIDGADVYNPEHFFGLFSTFNTDAIKNVEISKGGFGAEYGGRLSSVLDVTNLDGNRRQFQGKASLSLLSAKATAQYPLGKVGAISGSLRRTYFDKTVARFFDDIPDYYFYDGHLKAYFDLNENNKLTVSTYLGRDDLDYKFEEGGPDDERLDYTWGNSTGSVRWTRIFSPQLFGNFWITASHFGSKFRVEDISEDIELTDLTFKGNFEYFHSQSLSSKLGFEYKDISGAFREKYPGGRVDVSRAVEHLATYLQNEWKPTPLLTAQFGLRFNAFFGRKNFQSLAPRLSAKYRLSDAMSIKGAVGFYNQYLFCIPRTFFTDIWTSADEYYSGAQSHHYIAGFQHELFDDIEFEVEAYYKSFHNIYTFSYFFYTDLSPQRYDNDGNPVYTTPEGIFDRGDGHAYGLEFLLRRDIGPYTGWISYSLSRAAVNIDGINHGREFVPRHDRTSALNVVSNVDVKNMLRQLRGAVSQSDRTTWRVGVGFVYYSGQPITTTSSIYVTRQLPDQNFYHGYNLYPTGRNNFRLPPYLRLDISITMEKKYSKWAFSPYLQIFNVGYRKNVWFIDYNDEVKDDKIVQNIETFNMLPILPTIGVTFTF